MKIKRVFILIPLLFMFISCNTCSKCNSCFSCNKCGSCSSSEATECDNHKFVNGICKKCYTSSEDNIEYMLTDDNLGYIVTGLIYNDGVKIVNIPSMYNNKPVLSIGYQAFKSYETLEKVSIPQTVTSISGEAFYYCSSLKKVVFNTTLLTSIESRVFEGCKSLESIEIPNSVVSLGEKVFHNCENLKSITIPEVYGGHLGYLFGSDVAKLDNNYIPKSLEEVIVTKATTVSSYSFYNCNSLKKIEFKNLITINEYAIYCCTSLVNLVLPSSLKSVGEHPFYGTDNLENVYFKGRIEDWCEISFSAWHSNPMCIAKHFYIDDEKVTKIGLSQSITKIGDYQFYGFDDLEKVEVYGDINEIGESAFDKCPKFKYNEDDNCYYLGNKDNQYKVLISVKKSTVKSITINENTTSVLKGAFNNCSNLTNIKLSNNVIKIGEKAFAGCSSLTCIEIPNSVTSIDSSAFSGCSSLTSITLPFISGGYLGYIFGASSSSYNSSYVPSSLKEVKITGQTYIGQYAFSYCTSLTSIELPNSVKSIGYSAFSGCFSLENVYYNGTIKDWCNITFDGWASNPMYYANHFYIKNSNGKYEEVTEIEIPNTITKIGNYQFYGFNNVTKITIPNSVTSIGRYAFYNCSSLASIEIPNSVTSIGSSAFSGCSSLTSIKIPNSVTSIGSGVFCYCSNLTIYCEASSRPSGWDYNWNYSNCPVIWGYKQN